LTTPPHPTSFSENLPAVRQLPDAKRFTGAGPEGPPPDCGTACNLASWRRATIRSGQDSAACTGRAVPDRSGLPDRLRRLVPGHRAPPEVGLVRHMAGQRRMMAEHHVLYHRLPGPHCLEEIPQMHPGTIKVG